MSDAQPQQPKSTPEAKPERTDTRAVESMVERGLISKELAEQVLERASPEASAVDLLLREGHVTGPMLQRLLADEKGEPTTISDFKILGKLGQGGMATVYKAVQQRMSREVALKVIDPHFASNKEFCERFIREARVAGQINHPNVITCHDVGQDRGWLYMALELVTGGDAAQVAHQEGGKLSEARALRVIMDATRGLSALARAGLIHRDIKPANIFITEDGVAKLADLGLARPSADSERMTNAGMPVGTPAYMSPEQAAGDEAVDHRSDVYALGATLFALVTGQSPFAGPNALAVLAQVQRDAAPDPRRINPEVSDATAAIIFKAMAKNRDDRYATSEDLLEDLRLAAAGRTLRHAPLVPASRWPKRGETARAPAPIGAVAPPAAPAPAALDAQTLVANLAAPTTAPPRRTVDWTRRISSTIAGHDFAADHERHQLVPWIIISVSAGALAAALLVTLWPHGEEPAPAAPLEIAHQPSVPAPGGDARPPRDAKAPPPAGDADRLAGQYIVELRGDPDADAIAARAAALASAHHATVTHVYTHALKGFALKDVSADEARALAAERDVARIQQQAMVYPDGAPHADSAPAPQAVADVAQPRDAATPAPAGDANAPATVAAASPHTHADAPVAHEAAAPEAPVAHADAPVAHADAPVAHADAPVAHVDAPVAHVDAPVAHVDAPVAHVDAPVAHADAPVAHVDAPVAHADAPVAHADAPVAPADAHVAHADAPVDAQAPDSPRHGDAAHTAQADAPVAHADAPVAPTDTPALPTDTGARADAPRAADVAAPADPAHAADAAAPVDGSAGLAAAGSVPHGDAPVAVTDTAAALGIGDAPAAARDAATTAAEGAPTRGDATADADSLRAAAVSPAAREPTRQEAVAATWQRYLDAQHFRCTVRATPTGIEVIDVARDTRDLAPLMAVPMESLDLSGCERLDGDLAALGGKPATTLRTLNLQGCKRLRRLDGLDRIALERVNLSGCTALGGDLSALNGARITKLEAAGCENLRSIAGVDRAPLTDVDLTDCKALKGDLSPLAGKPIARLAITGCASLQGLHGIEGAPLKRVDLRGCRSLEGDLSALDGMRLERVELIGCESIEGLHGIEGLPLNDLNLTGCRKLKGDLSALRGMPLTRLYLVDCRRLASLHGIEGMALTDVDLGNCESLRGDLAALRGMPLKRLSLAGCKSLTSLDGLQGMQLTELDLSYCSSLAPDLAPLSGAPLTQLNLTRCSSLTSLHGIERAPLRRLVLTRTSRLEDKTALATIKDVEVER